MDYKTTAAALASLIPPGEWYSYDVDASGNLTRWVGSVPQPNTAELAAAQLTASQVLAAGPQNANILCQIAALEARAARTVREMLLNVAPSPTAACAAPVPNAARLAALNAQIAALRGRLT